MKYLLILWLSGMHGGHIMLPDRYDNLEDCGMAGVLAMQAEWEPPFNTPVKVV